MQTKCLTSFASISLWASLFLLLSCSSGDEPGPVDCSTSDLAVTFTSSDPTSCSTNDGTITATATGGAAPYQFALDAQAFGATPSFAGLGAGTYQLRVMDKNECQRSVSVTLKPFGSTLAVTLTATNSGCKTSSGAITINTSGGVGPYSYTINGGTASSTNIFSSLGAGSYSVKVTDNTGCSITQSVSLLSGVSFNAVVKNIIDTNCAVSGCHVIGGAAPISFTSFDNVQSRATQIKTLTQSGAMPKNGSKLPQAQLDAIACWVDDGALNN